MVLPGVILGFGFLAFRVDGDCGWCGYLAPFGVLVLVGGLVVCWFLRSYVGLV